MQQQDDVPLTPMVVDCVTFDRAPLGRRGYNEDQVDDFLDRVLAHPAFERGETDTGFLKRHREALAPAELTEGELRALLAVAASAAPDRDFHPVPEPYASMGAWRN